MAASHSCCILELTIATGCLSFHQTLSLTSQRQLSALLCLQYHLCSLFLTGRKPYKADHAVQGIIHIYSIENLVNFQNKTYCADSWSYIINYIALLTNVEELLSRKNDWINHIWIIHIRQENVSASEMLWVRYDAGDGTKPHYNRNTMQSCQVKSSCSSKAHMRFQTLHAMSFLCHRMSAFAS